MESAQCGLNYNYIEERSKWCLVSIVVELEGWYVGILLQSKRSQSSAVKQHMCHQL